MYCMTVIGKCTWAEIIRCGFRPMRCLFLVLLSLFHVDWFLRMSSTTCSYTHLYQVRCTVNSLQWTSFLVMYTFKYASLMIETRCFVHVWRLFMENSICTFIEFITALSSYAVEPKTSHFNVKVVFIWNSLIIHLLRTIAPCERIRTHLQCNLTMFPLYAWI